MSGIWNRIIPGEDRLPVHLVKAAVYLAVRGVFTDAQILAGLNAKLITPLDAAAQSDLLAVCTAIIAVSGLAGKVDLLERLDALNIAAEMGVLTNEAAYRTELGL